MTPNPGCFIHGFEISIGVFLNETYVSVNMVINGSDGMFSVKPLSKPMLTVSFQVISNQNSYIYI